MLLFLAISEVAYRILPQLLQIHLRIAPIIFFLHLTIYKITKTLAIKQNGCNILVNFWLIRVKIIAQFTFR